MCKIMEEYARNVAVEATIKANLKHNIAVEQIVQDLVEEYGIDSTEALQWINELKSETEIA